MWCGRWALLLALPACVVVDDSEKTDTGVDGSMFGPNTPPVTDPEIDPDADLDGFPASVDCDDLNPEIRPDAVEACDGIDNNCDKLVDDQLAATVEGGASFATLDEAIVAVSSSLGTLYAPMALDGVIAVCPGAWTMSPVSFESGDLTLRGLNGRAETTIASTGGGTLLSVDGGAALTVEGLTLSGALGPAVVVWGDSTLSLTASRLAANGQGLFVFGEDRQGGDVRGATITLDDVLIEENAGGADGGGLALLGAFDAVVTNATIRGNAGAYGGGVYLATLFGPANLLLGNVQVENNTASLDGGGVYTQLVPFVADGASQVVGNVADGYGGGIAAKRATVSNLLISGNTAVYGGGVAALYDPFLSTAPNAGESEGLIIDGNSAGEGGGLWIDENEAMSLRSTCRVTLNEATVRGGGALLAGDDSYLTSDFADFGSPGVDDNTPEDLFVTSYGSLFFGDDAAFSCSTVTFCD